MEMPDFEKSLTGSCSHVPVSPRKPGMAGENDLHEVPIDSAEFRRVLGHYPTGVCAITATGADGMPVGMVVGTFTSVSLDPPLVGFLPDKSSSSWPLIEAAGAFCANIFAADQMAACRQLASRGADKFAGVDYALSENSLPLIEGCIARIECRLHGVIDAGDHWFVLGRVIAMDAVGGDPMLFNRGQYGGFAGPA